jgi:hypothetical protein
MVVSIMPPLQTAEQEKTLNDESTQNNDYDAGTRGNRRGPRAYRGLGM